MAFIEAKDYRFFYPDEVEPAVFVEQMEIKQGTITLLVGPAAEKQLYYANLPGKREYAEERKEVLSIKRRAVHMCGRTRIIRL